jgi:hypothetical protein
MRLSDHDLLQLTEEELLDPAGGSSAPIIRQAALRLKRSAGAFEANIAEE